MNREQAQCLLGVAADANRKDVVSAHRRLISTVHPDKCSGPEAGRLAREATAARDVLLVPAETPPWPRRKPSAGARRKTRPASPSPARSQQEVDDVLLHSLRNLVKQAGRPLDLADLLRMFRRHLQDIGVSANDVRLCSARVLDEDFLAAGVARGFWELHEDGVRPVGWTEPPASAVAGAPERATRSTRAEPVVGRVVFESDSVGRLRRRVTASLRHGVRQALRWAAAVAAAGMFGLGAVGCSGLVLGAVANGELVMTALAVPVLFLCGSAGVWIMNRFGVAAGVLGRPAVFVPGSLLSVAVFLLLVL